MLPRTVHPDPRGPAPTPSDILLRHRIKRPTLRTPQIPGPQPHPGKDFLDPLNMELLPRVTPSRQREQLPVQPKPSSHHRNRLQGLVSRPRKNRRPNLPNPHHRTPVHPKPNGNPPMPRLHKPRPLHLNQHRIDPHKAPLIAHLRNPHPTPQLPTPAQETSTRKGPL